MIHVAALPSRQPAIKNTEKKCKNKKKKNTCTPQKWIERITGFLTQGGFFAQWNQVQSKDAFNSIGISGFFNVLNNGQLYGLHISIIPAILVLLLIIHLTLIRQKGVVPPIEALKK